MPKGINKKFLISKLLFSLEIEYLIVTQFSIDWESVIEASGVREM
jgi:hypothetical protein